MIAQGAAEPRLYMLMSMRADFLGELQKDEALYKVHQKIDVPPLREVELHESTWRGRANQRASHSTMTKRT